MKEKFIVHYLGCRTNQYEAQGFRDQLTTLGLVEAETGHESADVCVVNTCTVTREAEKESLRVVQQLAKKHPKAKIVVTGCAAEKNPSQFAALDQVVHVGKNSEKERLLAPLYGERLPEFSITRFHAHTRAFVKVQDGCNSFCTYCIIPYVRGRSRSRPVDAVLKEIRRLLEYGYKEIVLTGVNIGDYEHEGVRLADLVRLVDQLDGLERLRLSSIDPDEVDEALLSAIIDGKKTCPSMHIVLQSGSNAILKRMNRKYTRQMFFSACDLLRSYNPNFTFTTDVIVGFPGETEVDFEKTLEVIEEIRFAKVHMFPYSKRERTRAALYPDQIASDVMKARKAKVLQKAEQVAYQLREEYVGKTMRILVEGNNSGHTENFLQVEIPGEEVPANTLVDVLLKENHPKGLIGDATLYQAAV